MKIIVLQELPLNNLKKYFLKQFGLNEKFAVFKFENKEFTLARKDEKKSKGHKGFNIIINPKITIQEDLKRRDITINSIAKEILTNKTIDPFGGIEDIKNKKIKATNKIEFINDPVRIYRAARFSATLNFEISFETIELMKKARNELETISKTNIYYEFKKALLGINPSNFFNNLKDAKILDIHFKEIYNLIGVKQPKKYHPEGDSYIHTMITLNNTKKLTNNFKIIYGALVHDLGKGITPKEIYPHHYGHDKKGINLIEIMSNRIGIPRKIKEAGIIAARRTYENSKF